MATNGMTINGLNPLSALTADDKIPVWDTGASGEPTKEITASNLAASVKSLASLPNTTEMNDAIEQSTADVIRTGDVINDLTSTSTTAPLSANMGKTLNDKIINLVTKSTYVGTTDADGDISIFNIITGRVFVSAIPNRTYGDETYSSWFGVIVGHGAGGQVSVKCVNDNNQKLVSQKVAIDVYFIEMQQLG